MKHLLLFGAAIALLVQPAGAAQSLSVDYHMMTRAATSDCSTPVAETRFLTTDSAAILAFQLSNMKAGMVASSTYFDPDGNSYDDASGPWDPVPSDGVWCFDDTGSFNIAGSFPATKPGTWTVKVTIDGTLAFTDTFTIAQASSSGPPPDGLPGVTCVSGQVDYITFSLATSASRMADEVSIGGTVLCSACTLKPPIYGNFAKKLEMARNEGLNVDACYDSFGTMNLVRVRQ